MTVGSARPGVPGLTMRAVSTRAVDMPMTYVLGTSAGAITTARLLLVDLLTEEGVTGRTYIFCYRPAAAAGLAALLAEAVETAKGRRGGPRDHALFLQARYRLLGVTGMVRLALSAIDTALWDAASVAARLPLATLLGAGPRPLKAYNSCGLGIMAPEAAADEAERLLEGGFKGVKLRLGRATLEADLAAVRAVRRRLPDDVEIMVDFNQGLGADEALHRGRALDGEGLAWLEEPIRHDDWAGNAAIAGAIDLPLQIGENFNGPGHMAEAIAACGPDLVMPDLMRIGGISGWVDAAALAAAHGLPMSTHLFPAQSAHGLAATATAHWLEWVDWANPILEEPLAIVDGHAIVSETPGSGIAWNEAAVARYLV